MADEQPRWPAGTRWAATGPGPGRFRPAGGDELGLATEHEQRAVQDWTRRVRKASRADIVRVYGDLLADMEARPATLTQLEIDAIRTELHRRDRRDQAVREKHQRTAAEVERILAEDPDADELEVYARVTGQDPERLRRREDRQARPTRAQLRADWEIEAHREFLAAEAATNGNLVTPAGRARGIDPRRFWRSNPAYVNRWASDEFKEWAAAGGATTFAIYAEQMAGGTASELRNQRRGSMGQWA